MIYCQLLLYLRETPTLNCIFDLKRRFLWQMIACLSMFDRNEVSNVPRFSLLSSPSNPFSLGKFPV